MIVHSFNDRSQMDSAAPFTICNRIERSNCPRWCIQPSGYPATITAILTIIGHPTTQDQMSESMNRSNQNTHVEHVHK